MNTEPKPFASLSSGLLARKGAARPAMRPQGFGQAGAGLEDLGWNDMGFEPPKPAHTPQPDSEHDGFGEVIPAHPHNLAGLTPVESPVHNQQAEIAGRLSAYSSGDADEEEEIDDTAELYDPEAKEAEVFEDSEADEAAEVFEYPEADEAAEAFEHPEADEAAEVFEEPEAGEIEIPVARPEPVLVAKAAPAPAPRRERKPRAMPGSKGKAAFTLRLDPGRHLKLRLACAVDGRSAQMLVTQALDKLLADMPELDAMAITAKRKG